MKSKSVGLIIFILGLSIFSYPYISKSYYDYIYRQEVESIEDSFSDASDSDNLYAEQVSYNENAISELDEIEQANVTFKDDSPENQVDFSDTNVLGTMSIPAIDLYYPIYDGASDENLYQGLARVTGTSYPVGGINTNAVIAGHNGLAGKIYFSDIDQLVTGDLIQIQNRHEKLTYEVYDTAIIKPDQVSALAIIPGQDTLTLLTCIFLPDSVDRYLVYARRIENPTEEREGQEAQDNSSIEEKNPEDEKNPKLDQSSIIQHIELFVQRYGSILVILITGSFMIYWIFIRDTKR
ncbi:class C sortase [Aerococcus sp. 1KP-2016]|uniref:class C sortase n=1 Tax=Aerococcus sp. 1KP-2016 TaxID=1981982 RepID=UPI000B997F78|nr:class C sortase [Aerococcus sp. 1KP-2016]OYQ68335.1 hypothetical protein B9P78_00570 [Aerococcus sp. 1KP-2016]